MSGRKYESIEQKEGEEGERRQHMRTSGGEAAGENNSDMPSWHTHESTRESKRRQDWRGTESAGERQKNETAREGRDEKVESIDKKLSREETTRARAGKNREKQQ